MHHLHLGKYTTKESLADSGVNGMIMLARGEVVLRGALGVALGHNVDTEVREGGEDDEGWVSDDGRFAVSRQLSEVMDIGICC